MVDYACNIGCVNDIVNVTCSWLKERLVKDKGRNPIRVGRGDIDESKMIMKEGTL